MHTHCYIYIYFSYTCRSIYTCIQLYTHIHTVLHTHKQVCLMCRARMYISGSAKFRRVGEASLIHGVDETWLTTPQEHIDCLWPSTQSLFTAYTCVLSQPQKNGTPIVHADWNHTHTYIYITYIRIHLSSAPADHHHLTHSLRQTFQQTWTAYDMYAWIHTECRACFTRHFRGKAKTLHTWYWGWLTLTWPASVATCCHHVIQLSPRDRLLLPRAVILWW